MKLLPLIMLALPMTMQAQLRECNISKAFDDIVSAKGIHASVSQSTTRDVNGAHAERTVVHDFQVGKSHLSLLDNLQKAFQQDYDDAATFYTCFTSDFFHPEADTWRPEAWRMMRERSDCSFYMVTKRPERIREALPPDWGTGYQNVEICCTSENQRMTDKGCQSSWSCRSRTSPSSKSLCWNGSTSGLI